MYRMPLLSCLLSWRFYALEIGCTMGHPVTTAGYFDTLKGGIMYKLQRNYGTFETLPWTYQNPCKCRRQLCRHGRIYYTCTHNFVRSDSQNSKTIWSVVNISVHRLNYVLGHLEQAFVFLDITV